MLRRMRCVTWPHCNQDMRRLTRRITLPTLVELIHPHRLDRRRPVTRATCTRTAQRATLPTQVISVVGVQPRSHMETAAFFAATTFQARFTALASPLQELPSLGSATGYTSGVHATIISAMSTRTTPSPADTPDPARWEPCRRTSVPRSASRRLRCTPATTL